MTPEQFILAGRRLFGRKKWKKQLADALGVNVATMYRMVHRAQVPGPYQIAIASLLEQKKQRDILDKAARKLLPKGYKRWHVRKQVKVRKSRAPKPVEPACPTSD